LHPPVESGQFRSRKFVHAINRHGMVGSMGRVGTAGDNAAMKSFFLLLQCDVSRHCCQVSRGIAPARL